MALPTFHEYRRWLFPGYNTDRKKEDVCDSCVRLQFVIDNPNSTATEKEHAKLEKQMHISAAIDQRRAIKQYAEKYMNRLFLPVQPVYLPDYADGEDDGDTEEKRRNEILNDTTTDILCNFSRDQSEIGDNLANLDEFLSETSDKSNNAAIQNPLDGFMALILAEDFGSGIAMPHYGIIRPPSDYFNSNLMINLYVMSDISRGENNVILYDERTMGKDKDTLCSLRFKYHLESYQRCLREGRTQPELYISIRDNCVGQNKSNVTLQFDSFMAQSFYERVMVIYLIPGHSHMLPDRVVAWAKRALYKKNIYLPYDIVKEINNGNIVKEGFICHENFL